MTSLLLYSSTDAYCFGLQSRNLNSVIRPVVIGEEDRGTQLPLRVRKVGRN